MVAEKSEVAQSRLKESPRVDEYQMEDEDAEETPTDDGYIYPERCTKVQEKKRKWHIISTTEIHTVYQRKRTRKERYKYRIEILMFFVMLR